MPVGSQECEEFLVCFRGYGQVIPTDAVENDVDEPGAAGGFLFDAVDQVGT